MMGVYWGVLALTVRYLRRDHIQRAQEANYAELEAANARQQAQQRESEQRAAEEEQEPSDLQPEEQKEPEVEVRTKEQPVNQTTLNLHDSQEPVA